MTQIYLIPDPSTGTGIQAIQLCDDSPGVTSEGNIAVDSEENTATSTLTEHPVETGTNISDNVRNEPETISYTFGVSSSAQGKGGIRSVLVTQPLNVPARPLNLLSASALAGAAVGAIGDLLFPKPPPIISGFVNTDYDPVQEMWNALQIVRSTGTSCQVIKTTGETIDSMIITSLKRTRKDPGGSDFTIELKQVFTVNSATVDAPRPLQPRGAPAKSAGAQIPAPPGKGPSGPLVLVVNAIKASVNK